MKICYQGHTRIVFIFSKIVIKVTRINIAKLFTRSIEHVQKRQFRSRLKNFESNPFKAFVKYCFPGIFANRLEYYFSKKHKKIEGILPVRAFLFGIILIQKKGKVFTESDPNWKKISKTLIQAGIKERDCQTARNFCSINNAVYILDYGKIATLVALEWGGLYVLKNIKL